MYMNIRLQYIYIRKHITDMVERSNGFKLNNLFYESLFHEHIDFRPPGDLDGMMKKILKPILVNWTLFPQCRKLGHLF